jgi:hypothetical protein
MARTYIVGENGPELFPVNVEVRARKRWFFWPAVLVMVSLGKLGILKNPDRAAKWLADHAMRIEVR